MSITLIICGTILIALSMIIHAIHVEGYLNDQRSRNTAEVIGSDYESTWS